MMTAERPNPDQPESALLARLESASVGNPIDTIPVRISYEIIRLFSEGLYQSPHKAIEELVTNGFDAGATAVHVLTPRNDESAPVLEDSLWVIDNGTGMDQEGFEELWRVAGSKKMDVAGSAGRLPIGQFGIGKLAAYVLAWRLTHISKNGNRYLFTSMDFHDVVGRHQYEPQGEPLTIELRELDEAEARTLLAEIEHHDQEAWSVLFGDQAADTWTAAALSDFKDLYSKLREGTLGWVLRAGLPLASDFTIYLNGEKLVPTKATATLLAEFRVGGKDDEQAGKLGLQTTDSGILISEIDGEIKGIARLFEKPLTGGKSLQYGRSHGFFIRVRGRVINLEDELFGIDALNHAAWSRFYMEVEADGLRDHLLSSREGVRESEPIYTLREYLHAKFNLCRAAFEQVRREELVGLDIEQLLRSAPSTVVTEPFIEAVRLEAAEPGRQLYYIDIPQDLNEEELASWVDEFETAVAEQPFASLLVEPLGPYDRLARYDAASRSLHINEEHPFISKIFTHSKNRTPITLMAISEILTDAFIRESGIDSASALEFFEFRERALRLLAGDEGPDPAEVLRRLKIADQDKDALERAVGDTFTVLGFEYDQRGGNKGGPDGVLEARLGRVAKELADYKLVYDAKTTDGTSVKADKVDFASLWDFRDSEGAQYAFVIGKRFEGQSNPESAINRRARQQVDNGQPVTMLLTEDLRRIVELHYKYGVTLTDLRGLFDVAHTVEETRQWVDQLEASLSQESAQIPLRLLLGGLEDAKRDAKSRPNVHAVRAVKEALQEFEPERLLAALSAVEVIVGTRWLEVNRRSGDVRLHHTADQICREVERRLAATLESN
jgi:hypothetical protein